MVMINFMCELDCLDLGETLFQGVTIKVFLDEISISMDSLRKAYSPPQCR